MSENCLPDGYVEHKGLEPLDFVKYTLPLEPDEVDDLYCMGLGAERYSLPKNHLYNVLNEEELLKLCYTREGPIPSVIAMTERISKVLGIPPEFIPEGLVEAQLEIQTQQSYGKRSYKNFLRRMKRDIEKSQAKIKKVQRDPEESGGFKIENAPPDKPFTLTW